MRRMRDGLSERCSNVVQVIVAWEAVGHAIRGSGMYVRTWGEEGYVWKVSCQRSLKSLDVSRSDE